MRWLGRQPWLLLGRPQGLRQVCGRGAAPSSTRRTSSCPMRISLAQSIVPQKVNLQLLRWVAPFQIQLAILAAIIWWDFWRANPWIQQAWRHRQAASTSLPSGCASRPRTATAAASSAAGPAWLVATRGQAAIHLQLGRVRRPVPGPRHHRLQSLRSTGIPSSVSRASTFASRPSRVRHPRNRCHYPPLLRHSLPRRRHWSYYRHSSHALDHNYSATIEGNSCFLRSKAFTDAGQPFYLEKRFLTHRINWRRTLLSRRCYPQLEVGLGSVEASAGNNLEVTIAQLRREAHA